MRHWIRDTALVVLLATSVPTHGWASECKPVKAEEFAQVVAAAKPEELVFFASWCGGCVSHLKTATAQKSILVAVFDEKSSAEKAMRSLFKDGAPACYFDADGSLVKAYGVVGLPYTKKLTPPASGS